MSQRIKGQEVEVLLIDGGEPLSTITDVRSMEVSGVLEILSEGYLGETSDRKDEIFRGVRGRMELHFESRDVLDFMSRIIDRAARREAGVRINVKATLQFPSGQRVRIMIQNVFFGEIPIGFGSRSDYGTVSLDFESGERPRII